MTFSLLLAPPLSRTQVTYNSITNCPARKPTPDTHGIATETTRLPCDVAILMCDPEGKIKTGAEIFVFIHRPQEDFSDLLGRWRQTQFCLDKDYERLMPPRYQHMFSEGANTIYSLFVVFAKTPQRIKRGLQGAYLPFITQTLNSVVEEIAEMSPDLLA